MPNGEVPHSTRSGPLWSNRAFLLLWGGQTVSTVGDAFFTVAIMWVIYTQSHSALQTALIQVIWHLDRILFGPLAGVVADRWDRQRLMAAANMLSAAVTAVAAALLFVRGHAPAAAIFVAVFLLNSLNTFFSPALTSILPEVVGRDRLASAAGLVSMAASSASLVGNALAGVVIVAAGTAWAVLSDAVSFLLAALAITIARLPARVTPVPVPPPSSAERRASFLQEVRDGWRAMMDQPEVRALVRLGVLINVASFLGPLYPALVRTQLHGGAAAYGTIEAVGVVGSMVGGAIAGPLERHLGAGWVLIAGYSAAGACVLGIAASTHLPLTALLLAAHTCALTAGAVTSGALTSLLVPEHYRGRVWGLAGSLSVVAIPLSALVGGWLTDIVGVVPLFVFGGVWILAVGGLALSNHHMRTARI